MALELLEKSQRDSAYEKIEVGRKALDELSQVHSYPHLPPSRNNALKRARVELLISFFYSLRDHCRRDVHSAEFEKFEISFWRKWGG
jgi:hypothetical protein